MKISIVVPAFNEEKIITRSLGAIHEARAAFTELGWESEVIVCDNNSTDGTAKTARAAGARSVFEPVNQISRARNRCAIRRETCQEPIAVIPVDGDRGGHVRSHR